VEKTTLKVGGMSCEHCVKHVTEALRDLPGVSEVRVTLDRGQAEVVFYPDRDVHYRDGRRD
jgi:copper chaperone